MLALWWLGGVPYSVTVPELETRGAETFGGQLPCGVAAHSKVDPRTGELVFFDFSMYEAPFLQYGLVSKDRKLTIIRSSKSADRDFSTTSHLPRITPSF